MALKQYQPTTPGQRQLVNIKRNDLWKKGPKKSLICPNGRNTRSGHNNLGRVTSWNRGGGHKRRYRLIDFARTKVDMPATVERIEYDPNRSAFIALVRYEDGQYAYILAPSKLAAGDKIISSNEFVDVKPGNSMLLKHIPIGTIIHNVEMKPGKGGQIARSAGTSVQIMGRDGSYVILKLSSGEVRLIRSECRATVGVLSNSDHQNRSYGKAGRMRWLGRRPVVRGVAMNPIDHPHGGGEGRTSGGRHPVTPWGVSTKGKKTRHNKRTNKMIVRRRSR